MSKQERESGALSALLPGLRRADPSTYSVLVRELSEPLYRYAVGLLGQGAIAEDLVQATFVRLYRSRKRLPTSGSLRAYAFRVLRHLALNHLRDAALRRKREVEAVGMAENSPNDKAQELARELWEGVAKLDQQLREVIELRFAHGLTLAEVAETLLIPEGTVSTFQRRGLAELRKQAEKNSSFGVVGASVPLEKILTTHGSPYSSLTLPPKFLSTTEAVLMASMTTKISMTFIALVVLAFLLAGSIGLGLLDGGDASDGKAMALVSEEPLTNVKLEQRASDPDSRPTKGTGDGHEPRDDGARGNGNVAPSADDGSNDEKSGGSPADESSGDTAAALQGKNETTNTEEPDKETESDPAIVKRLGGLSDFESPDRMVSVVLSPNNKFVITADFGPQVKIWNRASGKILHTLQMKATGALTQVAISPDGTLVAAVGVGNGFIGVWRVSDGSEVMMLAPKDAEGNVEPHYTSLTFDPLGSALYAAGKTGVLNAISIDAGEQVDSLDLHKFGVTAMTLSSDGALLYFTGGDNALAAWDLSAGSVVYQQSMDAKNARSLSLSADGRTLLVVFELSHACTHRADDGTRIAKLTGGGKSSYCGVMHAQDPDIAIVADHFGTLELWNVRSGTLLHTEFSSVRGFPALATSRDGKLIAHVGDPGRIGLWGIQMEELIKVGGVGATLSRLKSFASMHHSNRIIAAYDSGSFEVMEIPSGKVLNTFDNEADWGPLSMCVSQDDQWLVVGYGGGTVEVWNLDNQTRLHRFKEHSTNVSSVTLSDDGRYFFSADWVGVVKMWDLLSGQLIREFEYSRDDNKKKNPHTWRCQSMASIGDLLVVGFDDRYIRAWDFITGELRFEIPDAQRHWVKGIVGYAGNSWFASSCGWAGVQVWDIQGASLGTVSEQPAMAMALAGEQARLVLGRYDGSIEVLDVRDINSVTQVSEHIVHNGWIQALDVTPDGRYLISGGIDNSIAIVDLEMKQDSD